MEAFYIPSASGNLAVVYHRPEAGEWHVRDLLFVHGFAHEHSIARPILASLWRRLACEGVGVVSVDLPGCGDSAGEFEDATWESWLAAISTAYRWLGDRSSRPIHVGGLRLGAALALESAAELEPESILLLQPVIRGVEMMTQFLRMRVAFSGLRGEVLEKETTQKLRTRIAAGEKLEVGGYLLSPELAIAIDGIELCAQTPPTRPAIHWIETGKDISPATRETEEVWKAYGNHVSLALVDVKPYWVYSRGLVPEYGPLADAVANVFADGPS